MNNLQGSCLCQQIAFEISGPIIRLNFCHCTMCQKNHGAAFAPYLRVKKDHFSFVRGEEFVADYASSEGITRTFCRQCGSNLQWIRASSDAMGIAAGVLDSEIDIQAAAQYWCEDAKSWHQLRQDVQIFTSE